MNSLGWPSETSLETNFESKQQTKTSPPFRFNARQTNPLSFLQEIRQYRGIFKDFEEHKASGWSQLICLQQTD